MAEVNLLRDDVLEWLLEPESSTVRYLTLRDLLDRSSDDPETAAAREQAHREGPIASILAEMQPEGYWIQPGAGYAPKYWGTVWSVILLGQLGASAAMDVRIGQACDYVLSHALVRAPWNRFSVGATPSGIISCLEGNLCAALLDLGCEDPRLDAALDGMARGVTGEGYAPATERKAEPRYLASGYCGPGFACSANDKLPCAWGAVKVILAFSKLPPERHTPVIARAIQQGVDFLFSTDPAGADYPHGYSERPSESWFKFGFPVFYVTDVLQNVEALARLGYGQDPRLANALTLIREKQIAPGRWPLEYHYSGKTWLSVGRKNQPNKWVTLRALRVIRLASTL